MLQAPEARLPDRYVPRESRWPRVERLAQAFSDPLRMRIVTECVDRTMSPACFHREIGGPKLARIEQEFELLLQYEWLECVQPPGTASEVEPAERLYTTTERPIVDNETWLDLPTSTRALIAARTWEGLAQRMKAAMKEGTIAHRADQHVSWEVLELDEQGWESVLGRIEEVFRFLPEEQEAARARLAESDEEPSVMTVGLLSFESPAPGAKPRR